MSLFWLSYGTPSGSFAGVVVIESNALIPSAPDQPKPPPPWWRPLTRWWGIFGVIIFIGLVMWLIEHPHFHRPKPPVPAERAKPALRVERPSSHFASVAQRTA